VKQLDKPVRQVLIESRIVIANSDFSRELGSRFSVNRNLNLANRPVINDPYSTVPATTDLTPAVNGGDFFSSGNALSSLPINPAVAGPGGVLGVTILQVGDYLLDLELSAAQREGRGEILSNPRLITADQTEASIMQGQQLPYTTGATATTVANIQFKNALLELRVTPHITPDDNVRMEINITRDTRGEAVGSNFAIDKREIDTTAQVANGETVVLGGVYEGTKTNTTEKVPFFGDLPGVGFMFRHNSVIDQKRELLIFITPKILKQSLGLR
jgi:type IV pilus assembly protein PilQ